MLWVPSRLGSGDHLPVGAGPRRMAMMEGR